MRMRDIAERLLKVVPSPETAHEYEELVSEIEVAANDESMPITREWLASISRGISFSEFTEYFILGTRKKTLFATIGERGECALWWCKGCIFNTVSTRGGLLLSLRAAEVDFHGC